MTSHREGIFVDGLWTEAKEIKKEYSTDEVGLSSAPLHSLSFALQASCAKYNEDYMLCKHKSTNPKDCLLEGRKVTRCSIALIDSVKSNCATEFETHWKCLDGKNQDLHKCRGAELPFNECLFLKFGFIKSIPDSGGKEQIHLKKFPSFK